MNPGRGFGATNVRDEIRDPGREADGTSKQIIVKRLTAVLAVAEVTAGSRSEKCRTDTEESRSQLSAVVISEPKRTKCSDDPLPIANTWRRWIEFSFLNHATCLNRSQGTGPSHAPTPIQGGRMPADQLDLDKVKEFVGKQLKDLTEPKQVKFRVLNKEIKKEFGKSLFLPTLSEVVKSARPDLAKPARKPAARRGRKPGPKPVRRPGRPTRIPASSNTYLVQVGRSLRLVKSLQRAQATIDKHLSAGQSLSHLKVYALRKMELTTQVVLQ